MIPERGPVPVTRDKRAPIPFEYRYPSHEDSRFLQAKTIYLAEGRQLVDNVVPDALYTDSDGWALQSNEERNKRAEKASGARYSAGYFEALLRECYENPNLQLVHILSVINRMTFYPKLYFGMVDNAGAEIVNPHEIRP